MTLTSSESFVLAIKVTREVAPTQGGNYAVAKIHNSTEKTFETKDTKFFVPAVTLLIVTENDNKVLLVLEIIKIIIKSY